MKRSPWRLLGISLRLGHLTLHIACAFAVAGVYPALRVPVQQRFMRWWSRSLLTLLKVQHHVSGQPEGALAPACLLVANHVSWLDIFAVNALTPTRFVAKSEVSGWPVLGWLVQRAGTLFIRRAVRSDTVHVNARMAGLLQQGSVVGLFAQGTSSVPGQAVQFHAPLLQSAVAAGARVQPIAIFYHDKQGRCHEAAAFVDDTSFVESLWRIVSNPGIQVTVSYLPPIDACGLDRRALAMLTQCAVNAALARHLQAG
ncbi:1-acyl-sn-glycerol-3-phosphate acyltransferase [Rhodoferax sp.]|uniref:lysophospholipid acyltransferase family protein n=1 Tax=Rhodoferax sp. TaxID=50421 RepID=UPI0019FBE2CA|nr:lysophospholipid acyltransferase family protein [Rhodoferax sp.]MBE0473567.1 1-acyl-sn-glycerol-3-phosphate acyltransferase [Rhodoferax sp.]